MTATNRRKSKWKHTFWALGRWLNLSWKLSPLGNCSPHAAGLFGVLGYMESRNPRLMPYLRLVY